MTTESDTPLTDAAVTDSALEPVPADFARQLESDCRKLTKDRSEWKAECIKARKAAEEMREVAIAMREWIDAVPRDTPLPSMPGFDRDWADTIIEKH